MLLTSVWFELNDLVLNLLNQLLLLLVMVRQQLSLSGHRKAVVPRHTLDYSRQIVTCRRGHDVYFLAIITFDFDPGDQLAGSGATLERYARNSRSFGFQYRSYILHLQNDVER